PPRGRALPGDDAPRSHGRRSVPPREELARRRPVPRVAGRRGFRRGAHARRRRRIVIAIPAVDLREGACVQLAGGSYARERVRLDDPLEAVRHWSRLGFRRLHLVDLDAATGRGSNAATIAAVLALSRTLGVAVQAGGGVRDAAAIDRLLGAGAERVVVGT